MSAVDEIHPAIASHLRRLVAGDHGDFAFDELVEDAERVFTLGTGSWTSRDRRLAEAAAAEIWEERHGQDAARRRRAPGPKPIVSSEDVDRAAAKLRAAGIEPSHEAVARELAVHKSTIKRRRREGGSGSTRAT